MNRESAQKIISEYLKPVFGFALKRCRSLQDAEDLSQEIMIRSYRALLIKDDICDVSKFIWTAAHNALSNYYRDSACSRIGISSEELLDSCCISEADISDDLIFRETCESLHREIAYLSKIQRRIIISYYYENKKQSEIADELNIPIGTVKWHLFEAKKDLKKGMETMRTSSELKFNPIRFDFCGTNGSTGTKGLNFNFFRSALSQNIAYAVRKEAKTINEIADALGVSPVYIESETDFLEEYGFLIKQGNKYISNILIDEPTDELVKLHDEIYERGAEIFANELFDTLIKSSILDDKSIKGGKFNGIRNKNFLMWSLIPYIAAVSGGELYAAEASISFEDAATMRPDGGFNICDASVLNTSIKKPKYFESMENFMGCCWNKNEKYTIWQCDSEWSTHRIGEDYQYAVQKDMLLLNRLNDGLKLNIEEYSYLSERGYIAVKENNGQQEINIKSVWLKNSEIRDTLISVGNRIKERHWREFSDLRKKYTSEVLKNTPAHLRNMRLFGLQYIFFSDAWFILHCLKVLLNNGKLKLPTEEQKNALTTLIIEE
ncbi:MAG: sigma-70 family RNA polymerase sigma factor [Clostridiales bacterium]|nr:sigma-70 family RNA polymerase sigma factor [Clostridiales bacterium]